MCPTRYPATSCPERDHVPEGKRLTRVGENSACKLKDNSTETTRRAHIARGGSITADLGREHLAVNNDFQSVCDKLTSMSTEDSNSRNSYSENAASPAVDAGVSQQIRDIAEVPAVEVITTGAVHLMSAAAVKVGLADDPNAEDLKDLDEARKLITALAGLVSAAAPEIGSQHAGPLRDGLRSLQLAFREASLIPDAPGKGPGEKFTGPVN